MVSRYYLRLDVANQARAVPQILGHLAEAGVRVQQLEVFECPDEQALNAVVLLTDPTQEQVLRGALAVVEQWPTVMGFVKTIRMELLN